MNIVTKPCGRSLPAARFVLWLGLPAACAGLSAQRPAMCVAAAVVHPTGTSATPSPVYPPSTPTLPNSPQPPALVFTGAAELSVDVLVLEVLARNPSLAQMTAAWQAAAARYPQVMSLDDPMLDSKLGPGSFGSNKVDFAYMVGVSQKYPWPGKLGLRGQNALAEASAVDHDIEDTRLQLTENARSAFYDYYLAARALEVNDQSVRLLREFRDNAATRFQTGLVPEQDVLQADVEIGRERDRRLGLLEMRQIAVARMNTLLHLPPDSPLPPPPAAVQLPGPLPDAQALRATALARRPDLQALADHVRAEEAALALAHKEYCPDFQAGVAYDSFWQEKELRPAVSLGLNVPLRRARRNAAVAEAQARVAQRRAALERQIDEVNFQAQEAYEKVRRSEQAVRLYEERILRDAEANVKAAQSAYVTGKIPLVTLIEAERNQVSLQDRYYEAVADYYRRRATLERVVGGPFDPPPSGLGASAASGARPPG